MDIAIRFGNERRSVWMLDLNNVTLNSLLTVNVPDNIESEPLSELNEQQQQDEDNTLDPSTFVLLYAEIVATILAPEKNTPVSETSESATLIETKPLNTDDSIQENQAINTLDDNVAVAWINSEYYQSEQDLKNKLSHVEEDTAEQVDFKLNSSVSSKESSHPGAQPIPDSMELLKKPFPLSTLLEQEGADVQFIASQTSKQAVPSAANDLINIPSQLHQDTVTDLQIDEASFTSLSDNKNEAVLMQQSELMEQNVFLRSVKRQDNFILKNNVSSDDELPAEESISLDANDFIQSKADFMPEAQTHTSAVDVVMQNEQPKIGSGMFQHIANNTANPALMKQDQIEVPTAGMPQSLSIPTDIEDSQWSKHFSDQVVWLGQQGMKNAVIKLHPEDLGPLEISIKVVNDSASVTIVSHSQQVRDMVDQTLPRLQEMMAEQGLNLAEVHVDSEKDARHFERQNSHSQEQLVVDVDDEPMSTAPIKHKTAPQGIIDYFA